MVRRPRPPSIPPKLLVVPTELEWRRLVDLGGFDEALAVTAVCGFGPVAAAARTAQLLAERRPARVVLVGIAGAYDDERFPAGAALSFSRVAVDGIGVGQGRTFRGPPALGFPQWPGSAETMDEVHAELPVLPLGGRDDGLLLTTCAASESAEHAAERLERFPDAVAEDMEGFAVAMACALHRTPLSIVRGISNRVGDRAPENWRLPAALAAARELVLEMLAAEAGTS